LHALDQFAHSCQRKGAELIVCTEKDKVKFTDSFKLVLPVVWLKMELRISKGEDEWKSFIERAKARLKPDFVQF
jgi:tetraacyldisaccharide-1-P 4'-kinase